MADLIQSMPAMAKDGGHAGGVRERRDSRFTELDVTGEKDRGVNENLKTKSVEDTGDGEYGEPVIKTGADVSKYAVSPIDTGLPSITLRCLVLGTSMAALSAALSQIYIFKPVDVGVSGVFLLLFVFGLGKTWEFVFPFPKSEEEGQHPFMRKVWEVVNPRPFGLKEHVVSTLMATTAAYGSTAVNNFAVQRLFYDTSQNASTAILATFSTAMFGYGLVGLLRPLTVYPSEMVYWTNLPYVLTMQTLHKIGTKEQESEKIVNGKEKAINKKLKLFWGALGGMAVWEIFPQYIFPLLNGISIPCLASQSASTNTRRTISQIFGGAAGNEGLGILAIGLDWQYVTSWYLSLPLVQQANSWVGYLICYAAIAGIYYSNTWQAFYLPILSTSIFSNTSSPGLPIRWNQSAVFGPTFTLNETALAEEGLPLLSGSYAWNLMTGNWAIGGLLAHVILFWGPSLKDSLRVYTSRFTSPTPSAGMTGAKAAGPSSTVIEEDIHFQRMKVYKEAPWWWYIILLVLAFFAGLIVVLKGGTTLPVWGYLLALVVGSIVTPFSNLMIARVGNGVATNQLMKMIAGAVHPGRPVANLYFSMWSHDVIQTASILGGDLKVGQYLKIPPRVMFLSQVWGSLVGCFVNYAVMVSITTHQRDVLLDPQGTNVWSGFVIQSLNSQAVTWSLSSHVFGIHSQYVWIPFGLLFGTIPTIIQYLIWKRYPQLGPITLDSIVIPIIYQYSSYLTLGVNSIILTCVIVGATTQVWIRKYHPRWFRKYIYLLGGALDGGAQIVVFILNFAVFGASGTPKPFPTWWGNPAIGLNNVDYCINTNLVPPT